MQFSFLLKKFLTQLVVPPFNLLLAGIFGLLILKRWPRTGRALIWSSLLLVLALATPAVSELLVRMLDVAPTFDGASSKSAQAIVILGGGLRNNTPEVGDSPSRFTLDRIRYGAMLAKQTGLPVLVTGGAPSSVVPEAVVMKAVLEREFGVSVRWTEDRSLDTEDNFKFSAALLIPENIRTVVLVTHDLHMLRALAHCEASGLKCIPAPVSTSGRGTGEGSWTYRLPNAQALEISATALHEFFGYAALSLK
jgi:uncharacterized SAM-binding protein YcdF (DUF218 family)